MENGIEHQLHRAAARADDQIDAGNRLREALCAYRLRMRSTASSSAWTARWKRAAAPSVERRLQALSAARRRMAVHGATVAGFLHGTVDVGQARSVRSKCAGQPVHRG
jgi:hypothetical protein